MLFRLMIIGQPFNSSHDLILLQVDTSAMRCPGYVLLVVLWTLEGSEEFPRSQVGRANDVIVIDG